MSGLAEGFEDVPMEGRGLSSGVADACGKAFADDCAQSLIPIGDGAWPDRAPKVSRLRETRSEAGHSSQQGQSQAVGAFERHGGWCVA